MRDGELIFYNHLKKAQDASDKAKTYYPFEDEFHKNYEKKDKYIVNAIKKGNKLGLKIVHDPYKGVVYFETPNGQVSFHYYIGNSADWIEKNTVEIDGYEWSGLANSRDIIAKSINDLFKEEEKKVIGNLSTILIK